MYRAVLLAALLMVSAVLAGCTGGAKHSDDDGLADSTERDGKTILVETMGVVERRKVTSDPRLDDTDGDGIDDWEEFFLNLDPSSADTDGDGLTDCQEQWHTVVEECEDPDFNDPDGGTGTDATKADSDPGPSRYKASLPFSDPQGLLGTSSARWGDGISDGDEWYGVDLETDDGRRFNGVKTNPREVDSDQDGLEDGEELFTYHTHPTIADTDGDGCQDGRDPWPSRYEEYTLDLQRVRIEGVASERIYLKVFLIDREHRVPGGTSTITASGGDWTSLGSQTVPQVRPAKCDFTPANPWVPVAVTVWRRAGPGGEDTVIDVASETPRGPGSAIGSLWWNVREEHWAWEPDGMSEGSLVRLRGPDGQIEFAPQVV